MTSSALSLFSGAPFSYCARFRVSSGSWRRGVAGTLSIYRGGRGALEFSAGLLPGLKGSEQRYNARSTQNSLRSLLPMERASYPQRMSLLAPMRENVGRAIAARRPFADSGFLGRSEEIQSFWEEKSCARFTIQNRRGGRARNRIAETKQSDINERVWSELLQPNRQPTPSCWQEEATLPSAIIKAELRLRWQRSVRSWWFASHRSCRGGWEAARATLDFARRSPLSPRPWFQRSNNTAPVLSLLRWTHAPLKRGSARHFRHPGRIGRTFLELGQLAQGSIIHVQTKGFSFRLDILTRRVTRCPIIGVQERVYCEEDLRSVRNEMG